MAALWVLAISIPVNAFFDRGHHTREDVGARVEKVLTFMHTQEVANAMACPMTIVEANVPQGLAGKGFHHSP